MTGSLLKMPSVPLGLHIGKPKQGNRADFEPLKRPKFVI